jgi:D-glycero-alpha-D-manno-heptose-7-phosphate kinase
MIKAKAPLRIDFAGGTTDTPPLFLLHWPAPVVNAAITLYATVTIVPAKKFTVVSCDQGPQKNAVRMERAFREWDVRKIAQEMNRDWRTRKSMLPTMTTPGIERLTRLAFKNGAMGLRTCGAGGGGCVAILTRPGGRGALARKIEESNMQVFAPQVARGIMIKKLK